MDYRSLITHIGQGRKRVLVIGMGISGIETAQFFERIGAEVVCVERLPEDEYNQKFGFGSRISQLREKGVELLFGIDGESVAPYVQDAALGIVSPGIAHESAVFSALSRRGVPLATELEIGVQLYGVPAIAVTGSNGKSTTVSLIQHVLTTLGKRSILCGNVGVPVVAGLDADWERAHMRHDALVVEASSYQLEGCSILRPTIGVLLNLSDNHLERHGTMERYASAKMRLFAAQHKSDTAVLNYDDTRVRALAAKVPSSVVFFGCEVGPACGRPFVKVHYRPGEGLDSLEVHCGEARGERFELRRVQLLGLHNRMNIAAAVSTLCMFGLAPRDIIDAIFTFVPLEHRLETVLESARGVLVVNDSKSTTVAASVAALRAVAEGHQGRGITLLIGGLVKAGSWDPLLSELKRFSDRMNPVVCFGKDGRILSNHCQAAHIPNVLYPTLRAATEATLSAAKSGDIVLLSPGSASFDEFRDFEDRGVKFKSYTLSQQR